ncbi:hypothetical protein V1264_025035 [Littorina saxatilis]|uniref:Sulfotransferase domain-containing protein n=1 Tax=Littorina saxatilis TaxID=31220 RepID=A0AAN9G0C3_9CAEN
METKSQMVKIPDAAGDTVTFAQYPNGHVMCPDFDHLDYDELRALHLRDDDIILCSYPRSGCHWLWEQIRMIHAGSTDLPVEEKQSGMFEKWSPAQYEKLPSPRTFNTHVAFHELPAEVTQKKTKLVMIYRHPKDSAVSLYHMFKNGIWWDYHGQLCNFLPLFLEGKVDGGGVADYLNDWARVIADNPDQPIHVLSYESLMKNPVEELTRLSRFLGKNHEVTFLQSVADACTIDRMRKRKGKVWEEHGIDKKLMYREGQM